MRGFGANLGGRGLRGAGRDWGVLGFGILEEEMKGLGRGDLAIFFVSWRGLGFRV